MPFSDNSWLARLKSIKTRISMFYCKMGNVIKCMDRNLNVNIVYIGLCKYTEIKIHREGETMIIGAALTERPLRNSLVIITYRTS